MRSSQQVIILKGIRKVTLCELPCNLSAFAAEHAQRHCLAANAKRFRKEATATKQSSFRHSGAMRSIEPGISRFPDAPLRI
jgi:hypothetical protein